MWGALMPVGNVGRSMGTPAVDAQATATAATAAPAAANASTGTTYGPSVATKAAPGIAGAAAAARTAGRSYTIKSGDTLGELAQRFGTTIAELMRVNPQIKDPDLIFAGKQLRLPGTPVAPVGTTTTTGTPGGATTPTTPTVTLASPGAVATTLNDPRFDAARIAGQRSTTANAVLEALAVDGVRIEVLPAAEFQGLFPGAGARYEDSTNRMLIPDTLLNDPVYAAAVLAHEGVHYLDDQANTGRGAAAARARAGSGVLSTAALTGLKQGTTAYSEATEAHAYMVEAQVARELGIRDPGIGTAPDGRQRTWDEIIAVIRSGGA